VEDQKAQCTVKAKELQTLENKDKTTAMALDRELAQIQYEQSQTEIIKSKTNQFSC